MRSLILPMVVAAILATSPMAAAEGPTLWFVGDGETHGSPSLVTDLPQDPTNPSEPAEANWGMALDGLNGMGSSYLAQWPGNVDADENYLFPTFIYGGEDGPVMVAGDEPLMLHVFADLRLGTDGCEMVAQLFDGDGNLLGPAGGVAAPAVEPTPTVEEMVFAFPGIAGEFDVIKAQATASSQFVDCFSGGFEIFWGNDTYPSGLALGDSDTVGGAGGAGQITEAVLDGPSVAITHQWVQSNETFVYTWPSAYTTVNVTLDITTENGTVAYTAVDGSGDNFLLRSTTDENVTQNLRGVKVTPGNWSITVAYANFTGSLRLTIEEAPEGSGPGGTTTETSTRTRTDTATTTLTDTSTLVATDTDSPGFGLLALLVAFGVALLALRRRL